MMCCVLEIRPSVPHSMKVVNNNNVTLCLENSTWKRRRHRGVDRLDTELDSELVPPIRRRLDGLSSGRVGWRSRRRGTVVVDQRGGGGAERSESGTVASVTQLFPL